MGRTDKAWQEGEYALSKMLGTRIVLEPKDSGV